jgi:hypothetical protein
LGAVGLLSTFACSGQTSGDSAKWNGNWTLDVGKSKFGTILMPDTPLDLSIVSQTLKIEQSAFEIKLSGDTIMGSNSEYSPRIRDVPGRQSYTSHNDYRLSVDGRETTDDVGSFSFRQAGADAFEIVSRLNVKDRNFGEVSHFALSADGRTLTETKIQTERKVVPEGTDPAAGKLIRTSKFVLVFRRHHGPLDSLPAAYRRVSGGH